MKARWLVLSFVLVVWSSSAAWAKSEDWYFNFGLGYGAPSYPAALQPSIDSLKNSGASHLPLALDLSFYWHIGPMTLLGPSINGVSDSYEVGNNRISIVQTGLFLSSLHSFGTEPGDGFMLRGDLGFARVALDTNMGFTVTSNYGLGLGAGAGWGLPVSDETRLLFMINYMYRHVEGENYGSTSFSVIAMF